MHPPEREATMLQSASSTSTRQASRVRSVALTTWHSARSSSRRVPCQPGAGVEGGARGVDVSSERCG